MSERFGSDQAPGARSVDETYGTYVDDEYFGNHDYDGDTDDDNDHKNDNYKKS